MKRYLDVFRRFKKKKSGSVVPKQNSENREGYGYIKRRVGLLSNEVQKPTYTPPQKPLDTAE
ncbi:MAG: hypothetical protein GQ474_09875 [Sulfurimonas sp.]|nr:hypothetical protein [Sulfurimonas sp.]